MGAFSDRPRISIVQRVVITLSRNQALHFISPSFPQKQHCFLFYGIAGQNFAQSGPGKGKEDVGEQETLNQKKETGQEEEKEKVALHCYNDKTWNQIPAC